MLFWLVAQRSSNTNSVWPLGLCIYSQTDQFNIISEHKDEEGEDGWRHLKGLAECRETLKWKTMRKGQGRGWDSNETEKDPGEQ